MKILAVRLRSLFDLFDRHLHPQRLQLANQPLRCCPHCAAYNSPRPSLDKATALCNNCDRQLSEYYAYGYQRLLLQSPASTLGFAVGGVMTRR